MRRQRNQRDHVRSRMSGLARLDKGGVGLPDLPKSVTEHLPGAPCGKGICELLNSYGDKH